MGEEQGHNYIKKVKNIKVRKSSKKKKENGQKCEILQKNLVNEIFLQNRD